jgi:small conductance mechanosensitive channel
MEKLNNLDTYIEKYGQLFMDYLPRLVVALLLLFVGLWVIRIINRIVNKIFKKKDFDPTLERFIANLVNWALKILLFVMVINRLGIESASLVAIVGAAGLAVGLALQGSLANFAGGVLILLLKPFKVGDFIKAQGVEGTVKEITIFTTKLLTFGNQQAIIPNGKLSNDTIINYTEEGVRRDAIDFGISYSSDIKLAKGILQELVDEQETVLQIEEKMPQIVVTQLGDSAVTITARYWTKNEDFWNTRFFTLEEGKMRLEAAGISIPFPQMDIHVNNQN